MAISQRKPEGGGAKFHIGIPLPTESYELISKELRKYVAPGSVIYSDSASASVALRAHYEVKRVNHDTHYKSPEGYHTNYVESLFSRWRRMEVGTYHRMNPRTLHLYFADCTWRENSRVTSSEGKVCELLAEVVRVGIFRDFRNYGRIHRATRTGEVTAVNKSSTRILRGIGQVAGATLRAAITVLKLDNIFGTEAGRDGFDAA